MSSITLPIRRLKFRYGSSRDAKKRLFRLSLRLYVKLFIQPKLNNDGEGCWLLNYQTNWFIVLHKLFLFLVFRKCNSWYQPSSPSTKELDVGRTPSILLAQIPPPYTICTILAQSLVQEILKIRKLTKKRPGASLSINDVI